MRGFKALSGNFQKDTVFEFRRGFLHGVVFGPERAWRQSFRALQKGEIGAIQEHSFYKGENGTT